MIDMADDGVIAGPKNRYMIFPSLLGCSARGDSEQKDSSWVFSSTSELDIIPPPASMFPRIVDGARLQ